MVRNTVTITVSTLILAGLLAPHTCAQAFDIDDGDGLDLRSDEYAGAGAAFGIQPGPAAGRGKPGRGPSCHSPAAAVGAPVAVVVVSPEALLKPLNRDLLGMALHFEPDYEPGDPWDNDAGCIYPDVIDMQSALRMGSARLCDAVGQWLSYDPPYENIHAVYTPEALDALVSWYTAVGVTKPIVELNDINEPQFIQLNLDLVSHAQAQGYGITYWEIGNESYADHEVSEYADVVVTNSLNIKSIDPGARIGIPLQPWNGEWGGYWNENVLELTQGHIDFVCPHYYSTWAGSTSDPPPPNIVETIYTATMAGPMFWQQYLRDVCSLAATYAGSTGDPLEVIITEWNVDYGNQVLEPAEQWPYFPQRLGSCLTGALHAASWMEMLVHDPLLDSVTAAQLWRSLDGWGTPVMGYHVFKPLPEYYVFELFAERMEDWVIATTVTGPVFSTEGFGVIPANGEVPALVALGTTSPTGADRGRAGARLPAGTALSVMVTNRHMTDDMLTQVEIVGADTRWFVHIHEINVGNPSVSPQDAVRESNNKGPLHPEYSDYDWVENVTILDRGVLLVDSVFEHVFPPHSVTLLQLEEVAGNGIPATSQWGVVAMTLLVMTAGTMVFVGRRALHA